MQRNTIAAIATPSGSGGIGVIKISGQKAVPIAKAIFRRSGYCPDVPENPAFFLQSVESHRMYHGYIIDRTQKNIIDEVLLVVMKSPRSYTCEDVVEIQLHGGYRVMQSVLDQVLSSGAQVALPGEFTKRAFLNGRIDLTQAEAVMEIVEASSRRALDSAANLIKGKLGTELEAIRKEMHRVQTVFEAAVDFPDETDEIYDTGRLIQQIQKKILNPIHAYIQQSEQGRVFRDGLKTVIVGRPNVGKSSLMNCLLETDRVIVTHVPGTTRDFIEDRFFISDIPVVITDTAGLHATDDPIESAGIKKVNECIEDSDLVLFVVDAACMVEDEERCILDRINSKKYICVVNKIDLMPEPLDLKLPSFFKNANVSMISARHGTGLKQLKDLIYDLIVSSRDSVDDSGIIPNLRHKHALQECRISVLSVIEGLKTGVPEDLIAVDIRHGIAAIDEILGVSVGDDVLDRIFSQFCIGK